MLLLLIRKRQKATINIVSDFFCEELSTHGGAEITSDKHRLCSPSLYVLESNKALLFAEVTLWKEA